MSPFSARLCAPIRILVVAACIGGHGVAGDWPQWMGSERNGTSGEAAGLDADTLSLRTAWKRSVGAGFSSPVVAGGTVYLHHRRDDREVLAAWRLEDGTPLWESGQPATYSDDFGFDEGPRGTPTVVGDRVVTFGASGRLSCHGARDGVLRWTVDTAREFKADKGFFGFACSPLVVGDTVVVQVGGRKGAGVVAFRLEDGSVVWKALDAEAGYASPIRAPALAGQPVVTFHRAGLELLDPSTGRSLASFAHRSRQHASVNAASPVLLPDGVFLSASYDTGAVRIRWDGRQLTPVWKGNDVLSSHYATPILCDGHLYGFHGRQESGAVLRCIDAAEGRVKWEGDLRGSGTLVRVGPRLFAFMETGELVMFDARPDRYVERGRQQVSGSGCRAVPAVASGSIVVRDPRQLLCLRP